MGNFTEALQVILIKLKDVEKAVKFVEKQSDKSLWNHLIERTLRDADELMPKLLDAVKGHPNVDAQELIQKIPNKLTIVGLKQKIMAIFEEYSREKLLTKGTTDILRSDCLKLGNKLYIEAAKGVLVNNSNYGTHNLAISLCMVCQLPLKVYPSYYKEHMARIQQMEDMRAKQKEQREKERREKEKSTLNKISAFGRNINLGINKEENNSNNQQEKDIKDEEINLDINKEEIGSTRLNIKGNKRGNKVKKK
eukprot:837203_1